MKTILFIVSIAVLIGLAAGCDEMQDQVMKPITMPDDEVITEDDMVTSMGTMKDPSTETDDTEEDTPVETQTPDALFVSATPASGEISVNGSITIEFDNDPGDVSASEGTVTGSGNTRTISGPFTVGSLALTITWPNGDGSHTLNYNVVADDTTPPMVTTSSTTNGAVDIDPATVFQNGITVTFNETIISGTLRLLKNGENVGWTLSIQNNTITLTPNTGQELSHDTMYQIVGTVKDAANNETDVSISFTTKSEPAPPPPQTLVAAFVSASPASGDTSEYGGITIEFDNDPGDVTTSEGTVTGSGNSRTISGPFTVGSLTITITWPNGNGSHTLNYNVVADDTTSPMLTTSSTTNGAVDIDPATVFENGFTVTFNETIISGTLRLLKNGENVGWTSSIQNNTITLTPNADQKLSHDTMYQIVGTVKDAADNETDVSISFTTKSAPAPPPPQTPVAAFVSATPASGNISENGSITINFDNDPGAVTAGSGTVTGSGNSRTISGPFTVGSLALTITWPNGNGSHTLNYNVVADDTTSPMLTTSSTTNGAVDIDPATVFENGFTVTFNETIISGTLRLLKNGENVGWTSSIQNNTITLTPNAGQELNHDTMYQIVGTVKDAADNETDVSISFTTKSAPAPPPPQTPVAAFVSATPASGNISENGSITINFDNDPGAVTASSGTVTGSGNSRTISGPFTVGSLALTITWPNGNGSHTLNYNVVADDTTSPMVTTSSTTNGAVDIDPATLFENGFTVTFNETIISGTLRLLKNGENVGWTSSIQNNTITLTPNAGQELSHDTMYQIVGTVKDAADNETDVSISFTTKSEPAPVVTLDPGEGLSNGAEAPDFELLDGDGNTYSLSEYSGIVVIVFYRGGW